MAKYVVKHCDQKGRLSLRTVSMRIDATGRHDRNDGPDIVSTGDLCRMQFYPAAETIVNAMGSDEDSFEATAAAVQMVLELETTGVRVGLFW